MFKLKVNIPYNIKNSKEKSQETTYNLILNGVSSKYPQGIDGAYRKTWARLQRKLDEAVENNANSIEIETDEKDLIKNVLNDGKFSAIICQYVSILEDEFEKCVEENKNKKNEK